LREKAVHYLRQAGGSEAFIRIVVFLVSDIAELFCDLVVLLWRQYLAELLERLRRQCLHLCLKKVHSDPVMTHPPQLVLVREKQLRRTSSPLPLPL
jgi:hypothetical protein